MAYEEISGRCTPAGLLLSHNDGDTSHPVTDPLLKERPAAKILTVSVSALQAWRRVGKGPRFLKIGGAVRYRRSDLVRFLSECECTGIAGTNEGGRHE